MTQKEFQDAAVAKPQLMMFVQTIVDRATAPLTDSDGLTRGSNLDDAASTVVQHADSEVSDHGSDELSHLTALVQRLQDELAGKEVVQIEVDY